LKHYYEFFGVERDDLDVVVIYFVVLAVFFHKLLLEILYYIVRIVIFQIVEDLGKEKLVAAVVGPVRFQLQIAIVATGKEELTREVTVVTDLPISVNEGLFTQLSQTVALVYCDCCWGVSGSSERLVAIILPISLLSLVTCS